jgi:hypothetical protein
MAAENKNALDFHMSILRRQAIEENSTGHARTTSTIIMTVDGTIEQVIACVPALGVARPPLAVRLVKGLQIQELRERRSRHDGSLPIGEEVKEEPC